MCQMPLSIRGGLAPPPPPRGPICPYSWRVLTMSHTPLCGPKLPYSHRALSVSRTPLCRLPPLNDTRKAEERGFVGSGKLSYDPELLTEC